MQLLPFAPDTNGEVAGWARAAVAAVRAAKTTPVVMIFMTVLQFSNTPLTGEVSRKTPGGSIGAQALLRRARRRRIRRECAQHAYISALVHADGLHVGADFVVGRHIAESVELQPVAFVDQRVLPGLSVDHVEQDGVRIGGIGALDLIDAKADRYASFRHRVVRRLGCRS